MEQQTTIQFSLVMKSPLILGFQISLFHINLSIYFIYI